MATYKSCPECDWAATGRENDVDAYFAAHVERSHPKPVAPKLVELDAPDED